MKDENIEEPVSGRRRWWELAKPTILLCLYLLAVSFYVQSKSQRMLFPSTDDALRYGQAHVFKFNGELLAPIPSWLPLPTVIYGSALKLLSGRFNLADYEILVIANAVLLFLGAAILATGLRKKGFPRIEDAGFWSALLFLSIPFVQSLLATNLSEPLQYVLMLGFLVAFHRARLTSWWGWRLVALLFAFGWMASRYEAWIVVGVVYTIFAWRGWGNGLRWPWLEWFFLPIVPIAWSAFMFYRLNDALFFLEYTKAHSLKLEKADYLLYVKMMLESICAVAGFLIAAGVHRCFCEKNSGADTGDKAPIDAYAFWVSGLLLLFMLYTLNKGMIGSVFPERFPVLIVVALCPGVGSIVARAWGSVGWNRLVSTTAITMAVALAVFSVFTFRGFSKSLIDRKTDFVDSQLFELAEIAREKRLDLDQYVDSEIKPWDPVNWIMFWWYSPERVFAVERGKEVEFNLESGRGVLLLAPQGNRTIPTPPGWDSVIIGQGKMYWPVEN